jgi:hypothetical protein
MVIHSFDLAHEEADRIADAVRHGIGARMVPMIGNVDIVAGEHAIAISLWIPAFAETRALRFEKGEQTSTEIERRVREKLADL